MAVTRANRQLYYHAYQVKLPLTDGGHQFYRTSTDEEFLLTELPTGKVVSSIPTPKVAMQVNNRYISSHSIQGVEIAYWNKKLLAYQQQSAKRQEQHPQTLIL